MKVDLLVDLMDFVTACSMVALKAATRDDLTAETTVGKLDLRMVVMLDLRMVVMKAVMLDTMMVVKLDLRTVD